MNTLPRIRDGETQEIGSNISPRRLPKLAVAVEAARQSVWLSAMPQDLARALLSRATIRPFQKGEVVLGIDEANAGLHFLLQGTIDVWIPRAAGDLFPVHLHTPLQWFGELGVITSRRGLVEYSGRSGGSTLVIPHAAIAALRARKPEFGEVLLDLLTRSMLRLMEMAGDHAGLDTERRVISKLITLSAASEEESQPNLSVLPLSQDDLANVACVSRHTVNTLLRRLARQGFLQLGYRRIVLLRRSALLAMLRSEMLPDP